MNIYIIIYEIGFHMYYVCYGRQGHLELWNANMSRCVQRIAPVFNRMAIFTVTDDAYHGHPHPLASPPGIYRYALQLVYYTRTEGPKYSNSPGPKRAYNSTHSAVFQPPCSPFPQLRKFCAECSRHPHFFTDRRCCECNYDRWEAFLFLLLWMQYL